MKNTFFFLVLLFSISSCKQNDASYESSAESIVSVKMPAKEEKYYDTAAVDTAAAAVEEPASNISESGLDKLNLKSLKMAIYVSKLTI